MPSDRPRLELVESIEDINRPRGILSKRDRQFLLDSSYRENLEEQSQRNVRSRLRKRIRNAILDFYILDENLDDRDRDLVFSEIDDDLREGLHSMLAFVYRAAEMDTRTLESWLEGGLQHVDIDHGRRFIVEPPKVNIEVTSGQAVDPESADAKIEAGRLEDLTESEMQFLLWRVGTVLGDRHADDAIFSVLGQYVKRFEEKTLISQARELIEESESD